MNNREDGYGAAGVTGAPAFATLAGGLWSHRPDLVDGGLIVGIDRFMSEARALTNFAGNAVADEATMLDDKDEEPSAAGTPTERDWDSDSAERRDLVHS